MIARAWSCLWLSTLLVGACREASHRVPESLARAAGSNPPEVLPSPANPSRNAYFGDLHIHTRNSFDAFTTGVRATPDDAYRYAKGEAIRHKLGGSIRSRGGPLDFLAVTDHGEYLGIARALSQPGHRLGTHELAEKLRSADPKQHARVWLAFPEFLSSGKPILDIDVTKDIQSAWQETIQAAERHNDPGRFTTFVGYEYTSSPGYANLHRNVIFSGSKLPAAPFSAANSFNPEDLWTWLDEQRAKGIEALAIPHNSNFSQGRMFERTNWAGAPIDAAYAERRLRNEPLVEVTQQKGTSETHPLLSPNDEWANFEIWKMATASVDERGKVSLTEGATTGAYVRDALRAGLEIEHRIGKNPYELGLIGSSDGHNAASFVEESYAVFEDQGNRNRLPNSASGLVGVWAEENTRKSIYAALRRKETFATSGPRIRVRFFAGYRFPETLADDRDGIALAYRLGVPMGAVLAAGDPAPRFFVWALRDPREGWLQRAQVVKGWLADGKSKERVFDVACSDGGEPDPKTHRCPDNRATVNLEDCSVSLDKGAVELKTLWTDPTFVPSERAFYYLRVLQNPTCRWSTWDAIRAGTKPEPSAPAIIQERAWSSPIWYLPSSAPASG